MKNIVPAILIAGSSLLACNSKTAQHTAMRQQELGTVMNLPRDGKQITPQDNLKNTPIQGISDAMEEEERKEEFMANGGTNNGDTTSVTEDSTDIYYTEFIQPGPH